MIDPTPEQIEREFANWRNSEIDQTGTLPTGYEMFRAAYNLAASAVSGRHDHIEDGSSYLDCIACGAAISMTNPSPEQIEAAAIAFTCETRDEWDRSPETYKQMIREDARDALVAAAGAAPQELSDKDSEALKAAAQSYAHRFQRGADLGLYVQIRNIPGIVVEWLRGGQQ